MIGEKLEEIQCTLCPKVFFDEKEALNHFGNHSRKENVLAKSVEYDAETTNTENQEVDESNKRNCEQCNNEFVDNKGLLRHKTEVHMKIKPFKCDQCGNSFARHDNLKLHVNIDHKGILPHQCHACEESFKSKTSLKLHLMKKHDIKVEEPVNCHLCSKSFVFQKYLDTHLKSFHNAEAVKCDQCGMNYIIARSF